MAPFRGWMAKVYKDGVLLGYCQSVTVDVASNLEPYYEIGSRTPVSLIEGNQEVTGTLERLWVDTTLLNLVSGTSTLDEFTLVFYASTATGSPKITLTGCKAESGSIDIPQDGELTESIDFRAKNITVETV